jgi:hypothetical protein
MSNTFVKVLGRLLTGIKFDLNRIFSGVCRRLRFKNPMVAHRSYPEKTKANDGWNRQLELKKFAPPNIPVYT